jgi:hypothetical protein
MARTQNPNLEILEICAHALGPLCDELVFLGGCVTALLITDAASPPVRVTRDVDVLAEAATTAEYHKLEKRLCERGFEVDSSKDAPICRWSGHGILLDVMPTDERILGFGNIWYRSAVSSSVPYRLPSGAQIRLIDPVHFIATKLEAYAGRGENDFVMGHDLEDVICVIDGRPKLEQEITAASREMRIYIGKRLRTFLADPKFADALPGHLPGDAGSQARLPMLKEKLEHLAALTS